jgi:predicted nucleic acid-binding protein
MIVADASALISLATIDLLDAYLVEYDVHTTETVVEELEATADYDDTHGRGAQSVLERVDQIEVHSADANLETSRIDPGEASTVTLSNDLDADFLITDDLRALPELQALVDAQVAISPIVLKALVKRDVLEREAAMEHLERLAAERDWLGAPIYRRAKLLFESDEPASN